MRSVTRKQQYSIRSGEILPEWSAPPSVKPQTESTKRNNGTKRKCKEYNSNNNNQAMDVAKILQELTNTVRNTMLEINATNETNRERRHKELMEFLTKHLVKENQINKPKSDTQLTTQFTTEFHQDDGNDSIEHSQMYYQNENNRIILNDATDADSSTFLMNATDMIIAEDDEFNDLVEVVYENDSVVDIYNNEYENRQQNDYEQYLMASKLIIEEEEGATNNIEDKENQNDPMLAIKTLFETHQQKMENRESLHKRFNCGKTLATNVHSKLH